ncbi:MAG: Fur family transcriptional regulator [Desulfurivibrionaceae bacterium]
MKEKRTKKILRMTNQRRVILEELSKIYFHPTASDVYDIVRKKLPNVSLGTVYRNLELLSSCRTIQKLDFGEPHKRFDGNPEPHYHINCSRCGRVDDAPIELKPELEKEAEKISGYRIDSHHISYNGLCPDCVSTHSDQ